MILPTVPQAEGNFKAADIFQDRSYIRPEGDLWLITCHVGFAHPGYFAFLFAGRNLHLKDVFGLLDNLYTLPVGQLDGTGSSVIGLSNLKQIRFFGKQDHVACMVVQLRTCLSFRHCLARRLEKHHITQPADGANYQ